MDSRSIEDNKVLRVIDGLGYDFQQFELSHFISHIAQLRQREILCKGMEFEENLFGMWLPGQSIDFIAYNVRSYAVHRTHIILHEIGHMVLNHVPLRIDELLASLDGVFHTDQDQDQPLTPLLLPRSISKASIRSNQTEAEAEDFVTLIQSRVILANRFKQLITAASSIENLQTFIKGLGLQE